MLNSANAQDQAVSMVVHKTPEGKFSVSSRNHPDIPPAVDVHQQTAISKLLTAVKSAGTKYEPTGF